MTATDIAAPPRSAQQRMEALQRANAIRTYRKVLKLDVKNGCRSGVEALADPPPQILTMKVYDLLLAMPKVGRVKAQRAMLRAGPISPSKTVGGISDRQRQQLLGQFTRA